MLARALAVVAFAIVSGAAAACSTGEDSDATREPAGGLGRSAGADTAASTATGDDATAAAQALLGGIARALGGSEGDDPNDCTRSRREAGAGDTPLDSSRKSGSGIALEKGLQIVWAVTKPDGDRESRHEITHTDSQSIGITIRTTLRVGNTDRMRPVRVDRTVLREDLQRAGCYALAFDKVGNGARDPSPGVTWDVLSRAIFAELRAKGETEFGLANEPEPNDPQNRRAAFRGTMRRVSAAPFELTIDDSLVQVPAVLLRAKLRYGDAEKDLELEVLDDPDLALVLRRCCVRSADRVVRILGPRSGDRIERALTEGEEAVVYGITFEFASADLTLESEPVLAEITDVMRRHPDWRLRIEGHTDSIGQAAANADLSRRRAEAVKLALVRRLGGGAAARLTVAGAGESRPRADNGTLEGRAANRRVELARR